MGSEASLSATPSAGRLIVRPIDGVQVTNPNDQQCQAPSLWKQVAPLVGAAAVDLTTFRRPGGANSRLAHWEPAEPTLRWFKSYLQLAAESAPHKHLEHLGRIGPLDIGSPVSVRVQCQTPGPGQTAEALDVNLDYLLAIEEFSFVEEALRVETLRTIVELGAGFGRTCHVLLELLPNLEHYYIVDLPETLSLSKAYLSAALPSALFHKIEFVRADDQAAFPGQVDLFFQIDGLQEMPPDEIDHLYRALVCRAQDVYVCNPIGKYEPEIAGVLGVNPEGRAAAMRMGRCRSLVDPWDEVSLHSARAHFVDAYRPVGYDVVRSTRSRLRPFYQHVLYSRTSK